MKNRIIELLQEAQALAKEKHGIKNIAKPGVIRDLIMAATLGQEFGRTDVLYIAAVQVYGTRACQAYKFQIPGATGRGVEKRLKGVNLCYFGFFDGLTVLEIWEVPPEKLIRAFVLTPAAVKKHGRQVYPPPAQPPTP